MSADRITILVAVDRRVVIEVTPTIPTSATMRVEVHKRATPLTDGTGAILVWVECADRELAASTLATAMAALVCGITGGPPAGLGEVWNTELVSLHGGRVGWRETIVDAGSGTEGKIRQRTRR